ncbi:hypothetical protein AVEN_273850-1 [Araneus ventricosus]|uniref:Uncharacterized protein n=1 Tax=Araneus ventricosus TaxID=182803 RepID=A0A4Y2L129_ARAVE|nr:hypothetical protein AVEN_273850-1 [Araneus ventricosus]
MMMNFNSGFHDIRKDLACVPYNMHSWMSLCDNSEGSFLLLLLFFKFRSNWKTDRQVLGCWDSRWVIAHISNCNIYYCQTSARDFQLSCRHVNMASRTDAPAKSELLSVIRFLRAEGWFMENDQCSCFFSDLMMNPTSGVDLIHGNARRYCKASSMEQFKWEDGRSKGWWDLY